MADSRQSPRGPGTRSRNFLVPWTTNTVDCCFSDPDVDGVPASVARLPVRHPRSWRPTLAVCQLTSPSDPGNHAKCHPPTGPLGEERHPDVEPIGCSDGADGGRRSGERRWTVAHCERSSVTGAPAMAWMCQPHYAAVLSPGGEYLDPYARAHSLPPENPGQRSAGHRVRPAAAIAQGAAVSGVTGWPNCRRRCRGRRMATREPEAGPGCGCFGPGSRTSPWSWWSHISRSPSAR